MLIALDVVIGLILVFLLYSLLASIFQEMIAAKLNFRPKNLRKAIVRMLNDSVPSLPDEKKKFSWTPRAVKRLFFYPPGAFKETLAEAFYKHPGIKYLAEDKRRELPDFITAQKFAQVMIDILRGEDYDHKQNPAEIIKDKLDKAGLEKRGLKLEVIKEEMMLERAIVPKLDAMLEAAPPEAEPETEEEPVVTRTITLPRETALYLRTLLADANNDVEKFRLLLEQWYEDVMKLATTWYKRTIQMWLFIIGFATAVFFNVDSIYIARLLSKDQKARENLVQLAASVNARYQDSLDITYKIDTTGGKNDTTKTTIIRFKGDTSAQQAYEKVMGDITAANNILGLGWDKESLWCYGKCKKETDSLAKLIAANKNDTTQTGKDKIAAWQKSVKECRKFTLGKFFGVLGTGSWWLRLVGWVITALAISLGAPFWFDLLNKVIRMRTGISSSEAAQAKQEGSPQTATPKG